MPRLNGWRTTRAPACSAAAAVLSVDPSSTTSTSKSGAARWSRRTTSPTQAASLYDGTTASLVAVEARLIGRAEKPSIGLRLRPGPAEDSDYSGRLLSGSLLIVSH